METQVHQVQGVLMHLQNDQAKISSLQTCYSFSAFDPTCEIWKDYWSRFNAFLTANGIARERCALIFLTNQSKETYQLIKTEASPRDPPSDINTFEIDEILGKK